MTKVEALKIVRQMSGRQYGYIKDWGLSTVREACTYLSRRNITATEQELLNNVQNKLSRKW